jgi:hypothetical protein
MEAILRNLSEVTFTVISIRTDHRYDCDIFDTASSKFLQQRM